MPPEYQTWWLFRGSVGFSVGFCGMRRGPTTRGRSVRAAKATKKCRRSFAELRRLCCCQGPGGGDLPAPETATATATTSPLARRPQTPPSADDARPGAAHTDTERAPPPTGDGGGGLGSGSGMGAGASAHGDDAGTSATTGANDGSALGRPLNDGVADGVTGSGERPKGLERRPSQVGPLAETRLPISR